MTAFSTIPDAPVSKFTPQITRGPKGLLVITARGRTICGKAQVANVSLGAHSGTGEAANPTISTPACKGVRNHKRKRHARRQSTAQGSIVRTAVVAWRRLAA